MAEITSDDDLTPQGEALMHAHQAAGILLGNTLRLCGHELIVISYDPNDLTKVIMSAPSGTPAWHIKVLKTFLALYESSQAGHKQSTAIN